MVEMLFARDKDTDIFVGTSLPSGAFGAGTGPILVAGVQCHGIEDRLVDCSNATGQKLQSCTHAMDAGLRCASTAC